MGVIFWDITYLIIWVYSYIVNQITPSWIIFFDHGRSGFYIWFLYVISIVDAYRRESVAANGDKFPAKAFLGQEIRN
jgi:hypothetical protein